MEENKNIETPETPNQPELTDLQKQIAEYEKQVKSLKATLSERNSEAANRKREAEEWKNKYTSTLSEQEQLEAKRREAEEATARELAELKRDSMISKHKAKYLSMGYSEELAQSSAEARADGNDDILFKNEATFAQQIRESAKAEYLKGQPSISSGQPIGSDKIQSDNDAKLRKYFGLN